MKNILVFIDGTGNEPDDAEQNKWFRLKEEDNSISNVLKLHLMAGGVLDNSRNMFPQQLCLYYPGVGTSGIFLEKAINAGLAISEPKQILQKAVEDLVRIYQPGDNICIFGFSRGAATARQLASSLGGHGNEPVHTKFPQIPEVSFLGVWDTVASFGLPQRDNKIRKISVLNEQPELAANIKKVLHLVSIDDPRIVFTPTLFNTDPRVTEVWFAGVHSDVGGGYQDDQLSDVALEFMKEQFLNSGIPDIKLKPPEEVDLSGISGNLSLKHASEIGLDDLHMSPNPLGTLHDKDFKESLAKEWFDVLNDREIHTLIDNQPSNDPVLIHQSVLKRVQHAAGDYNPKGLRDAAFRVFGESPEVIYNGLNSL